MWSLSLSITNETVINENHTTCNGSHTTSHSPKSAAIKAEFPVIVMETSIVRSIYAAKAFTLSGSKRKMDTFSIANFDRPCSHQTSDFELKL